MAMGIFGVNRVIAKAEVFFLKIGENYRHWFTPDGDNFYRYNYGDISPKICR